jgi:hypothetical protein
MLQHMTSFFLLEIWGYGVPDYAFNLGEDIRVYHLRRDPSIIPWGEVVDCCYTFPLLVVPPILLLYLRLWGRRRSGYSMNWVSLLTEVN